MPTPQFLAWLDGKMKEHGQGKLVPPAQVLQERLEAEAEDLHGQDLKERILAEAGYNARRQSEFDKLLPALRSNLDLGELVSDALDKRPESQWTQPLTDLAAELVPRP
jgi:hypothetical protein